MPNANSATRKSATLKYHGIGSTHATTAAATTVHVRIRPSIRRRLSLEIIIRAESFRIAVSRCLSGGRPKAELSQLRAKTGRSPDRAEKRKGEAANGGGVKQACASGAPTRMVRFPPS